MDTIEYFANKALENSRAVVAARAGGWSGKNNEYAIQRCAAYVMEHLVLQAHTQRYDADMAVIDAANDI